MRKIAILAALLAVMAGCGKDKSPEKPPAPPNLNGVASVEERMADKEYVARLDVQRDEQKRLAARAASAKTDEEKKAAAEALEQNRQRTMELIRARMKKDKGS